MDDLGKDLNTTIAAAVSARVEAQVASALLNDDTFTAFVVAALQKPIEVGDYSRREKTTWLAALLKNTIEAQTKEVVASEIAKMEEPIRVEVRKALKKSVGVLADALVDGFVAQAAGRHPSIKVEFAKPSDY